MVCIAPSLIATNNDFPLIPNSTHRVSLRTLASPSEFTDLEQMSIRMRRCVMFHPSSMKRTITAITSLCLLLGSKITDRSLVISTSPGTDSSSILYPSNFLLENEGYVLPETDATGKSIAIFSNKGRGLYIFPMGIRAVLMTLLSTKCFGYWFVLSTLTS